MPRARLEVAQRAKVRRKGGCLWMPLTSGMGGDTQPGPTEMAGHSVPLLSDRPRSPPSKDPSPLWGRRYLQFSAG